MHVESWIGISAMVISVVTLISLQLGQRRAASTDYVSELEKRIEVLERHLREAELRITDLERENSILLKEKFALLEKLANMVIEPRRNRRARNDENDEH